ncbi:MAG: ATP-binding protein, partial [Chitinivibrionales bacterium]|nr:ATP-binding protein [Chitinivibrionales bacterium]
MKLPFLNRNAELSRINRARAGQEAALMIVYGRRRCGKSRLINQLPEREILYHLADLSEPTLQRTNLAHDIQRYLPGFADVI